MAARAASIDRPRAAAGDAPAVEALGLARRYGAVWALEEASFRLQRGQFLTVLGPSGSGKSTLLRLIAGFERPDRGHVRLFGAEVDAVPPHRRPIGMVFQRLALFPHMTAAGNVAFPLEMRRFDPREIPARVERFLKLVRLEGLGERRPHELSGGQQQRVAIARALVFEPELLLLDEPLASLDVRLKEEMQLEFRRIQRELGVTTINVTHDQREALVLSDRVIVMERGRILQEGDPETVWRDPAHPFVARFLGVGSMLRGRAEAGPALRIGDRVLPGRAPNPATAPRPGQPAVAALRAERVRVGPGPTPPGDGMRLAARVEDTVFEGERVLYELSIPELGEVRLRAVDLDPGGHARHRPGAEVWVAWSPDDLLLFDASLEPGSDS
ncbi:MAG: ABC transporter ATP-binding protein [Geminicoccaceae bacterium]|nr:ABC transporter ATP-binding protein [Geminicoccaceae bacterium]